jgi:hypothetical protein
MSSPAARANDIDRKEDAALLLTGQALQGESILEGGPATARNASSAGCRDQPRLGRGSCVRFPDVNPAFFEGGRGRPAAIAGPQRSGPTTKVIDLAGSEWIPRECGVESPNGDPREIDTIGLVAPAGFAR